MRGRSMKKLKLTMLLFIALLFTNHLHAHEVLSKSDSLSQTIKEAINDLVEDNAAFADSKSAKHFRGFLDIQNPRVTMVLCSDSRVQADNFSKGAENDIFMARNIGNQFITTQGSIEYGVDVLKTPVLIFVGHSHCGAVKAAMGDFSQLPTAIRKEIQTIDVSGAANDQQGVSLNVHHQVEQSLNTFKNKVDSGHLAIIGAIYDFRDDYGYGKGRLIIVNLNGIKDPKEIQKSHYFDDIKKVVIGIQ
jgi:carbonic anhydrase